jgi:outer membrane biosynthesis protein TonB
MNEGNRRFRRNFIICAISHGVMIGALVLCGAFIPRDQNSQPIMIELTPAAPLGDQPKGSGYGLGAYTPASGRGETVPAKAPQRGSGNGSGGPSENVLTPEEQAVPPKSAMKALAPKPAPVEPGEIAVPKKGAPTKKTATASANSGVAAKTGNTTRTAAKPVSAKSGTGGGTGPGSANAIRQRLASALQAQEGGTPYGDNKPAGGGTGVSQYGHPGSPDGAENGVAGGIGKGSPFWWYYQQVNDRMYEAWDQPVEALNWDKRIVTTLSIRVARDGRVVAVMLKNSSGNRLMDDSVFAGANSVPRLDPLPEGLGGEFADILVNFRLKDSKG